MKNFNLIEMAKAMKEHKLRHMWRYVAMIFAVLVMSMANIGTAWGTTYHLISGDAVNTTNFMASGGTYTKQSSGVTIGGTKFGHYVLGGTASSASGGYAVNKVIIYNCQTTNTSITIIAYNKNSSSNRSYSVTNIEEGFSGTLSVQHTETISKQDSTHKTLTYTNTTNRTIYIHVAGNAGDMCFLDVEVNETGTALPKAGDAGYALNLNKGRLWAPSSAATTMPYEGLTFYPSSNYQCYGSSTSLAFTKKSTTTYFKFTNTSPCKLKVTFTNGLVYNTSQSHTGATALTSATATNDLSAGTYYIMADGSTNSNPAITKIEFLAAAASCDAAPTAPTGLAAGSITASGATFTITDGAGTNNYEIVCKTASGSPAADATPTATGTSTSITVSTLSAGTTYYAWVRAVCDATHKSSWVALGSSSFTTLTTPTATFSNSTYAIGGSALDLSSLWSSNSGGAVTFSVDSAGTTGASVSTAAFSATTAGYAKVKAVQAANGSYDAITKYAYIQVGSTEMGSHTITYNLKVNVNSTALQHCPSVIPTSLYLEPSKTIGTNGSGGPLSSGQSAQSIETQKFYIDNSTSTYNSSNYVSYTFTVADGYTFEPTSVTVKFQSVSGLCNFHYELTDGVNTISKDFAATTSTGGTPEDAVWSGSGTTLSGTVTLKVFAYKQADAATAYRFGTPITITGTVEAAAAGATYKLKGDWDSWTEHTMDVSAGVASYSIDLPADTRYEFCFMENSTAYKNNGTVLAPISNWDFSTSANNAHIHTGPAGTYTFSMNTSNHKVSVTYPDVTHPSDHYVYFKNTSVWETVYAYLANSGNDNKAAAWPGCPTPTTTICGETYHYAAMNDMSGTYNLIIFNNGGNGSGNQSWNLSTTGSAGKYNANADANWYEPAITITLNANKGSGTMDKVVGICSGDDKTLPTNTFTRTGWTFAGWNTDKYGGGDSYTDGGTVENVTANMTLYAQWERTIYFYSTASSWYNDDAVTQLHAWDSDDNTKNLYITMTQANTCASPVIYKATISAGGYNKLQFKRLKSDESESWNETVDLNFNDTYSVYKLTNMDGGEGNKAYGVFDSNYEAPTFTISYAGGEDAEDGEKDDETKTCDVDFTLPSSAVFTRSYYTQTGWALTENGSQSHALGGNYTTNADQTFYPVWTANNYDLTWNLDGGTTTSAGTGIGSGVSSNTTSSVAFGTALTAPTVTKTGYNFSAWDPAVASTMPAANTTYTAQWTAKTTAITLDAGEGGTDGSATATYGTNTITDYEAATRTGYTLGNYYQDGSKNNILTKEGELNSGDKGSLIVGGNWASADAAVTLYAKWTAIEYTLSYTLAGGSVASPNPTSYTIESSAITLNNPTKTGYTFAGWTGTGLAEATTTVTIAAGSTGNRSYTATWTAIVPSSVSLKSSTTITVGGTETLTATISPAVVADNTITWTSSDETVATVTSAGVVTGVKAGTATITATTHNGRTATCEVTVAPAVTYTVTYEYNGATSGDETESATGASVSLPNPTKEGYTLQGWYTSSGSLAGAATATYNPTSDITLYALWREDECAGGGGGGGDPVSLKLFDGSTDAAFAASPISNSGVSVSYTSPDTPSSADVSSKTNNVGNSKNYSTGFQYSASQVKSEVNRNYLSFTVPSGYTATFTYAFAASGNDRVIRLGSSFVLDNVSSGYLATLVTFPSSNGSKIIEGGTYSSSLAAGTYYITGTGGGWQVVELIFTLTPTGGGGSGTCYYVTYNGNGADGGFTKDEASHASGSNVTVASNSFTKTGYTFQGWATSAGGSVAYNAGDEIENIEDDVNLYAVWEEEGSGYTVSIAANPAGYGTVSSSSVTSVASGTTLSASTNTLSVGATNVTASATSASAEYTYAFSNWTKSDGTALPSTVTADLSVYANFTRTANNYILTWSSNGGSDLAGDYTSGSTAYSASITAPNDPTLSNYTFDGWKTNNDGTGTTAGSTMPAAATTYYAAWKQTVTLTTGAQGSGGNQTPYVYLNGTGVSSFTAHTATGYTLQGYYTAGSGGVKVLNADGTFAAANVTDYITSSKWSRTGAAPTLYAQWVASEDCRTLKYVWKVTGNFCDDQSTATSTVSMISDNDYFTLSGTGYKQESGKSLNLQNTQNNYFLLTAKTGYQIKSICFYGKVQDSSVDYTTDGSSWSALASTKTDGDKYYTFDDIDASAFGIKLTAATPEGIWIRNMVIEVCAEGGTTYNVTYNGNDETGGTAPTDATNYSYGDAVTVKGNTGSLEKTNYTFAGWTTNNNGTGSNYVADNTFSITANTTLYAKWTQTVTFDANTANHGSTGGSATAVWNATGLTGITHATPASGYKLLGYYTAPTSGTKVLNSDGSFADDNITDWIDDGKWVQNDDDEPLLYAQYEASGSIKWNLQVNSADAPIVTSSKNSSYTQISTSNMTNLDSIGLNITASKKSELTSLISTPDTKGDDCMYVTFKVATGYKFTPSLIKAIIQPVGKGEHKAVEFSLADESSHTLASASATKCDGTEKGKKTTVTLAGDGTYFTGTVTLKIFVYKHADGTNSTAQYRLGTPIQIDGAVEATCTMPSYESVSYSQTEYTVGDTPSSISVEDATGDPTYQWKYNSTGDRSSGTNGVTTASMSPSTASAGTTYYWCELTNACGTVKTPAVAITVSASKSDAPSIVWTDPASVNYGGGGYTIRATVNDASWNGNASDLTITAPAGIRIYNTTTGTDGSSKKYIEVKFDVQTAFDRETYSSNIPFTVSADATASYNAISADHNVSYSACSGGGGSATEELMPVDDEHMDNSTWKGGWVYDGIGMMRYGHGSSDIAAGKDNANLTTLTYKMESNQIDTYYKSSANHFGFYTEKAITGIRLYVYTSNDNVTVSGVYVGNSAIGTGTPSTGAVSYEAEYNDDNDALRSGTHSGSAWVDITFASEVAAGKYGQINLSKNVNIAGMAFISASGSGATLTTTLAWSETVDNDTHQKAVTTSDASFTITASPTSSNSNTLGAITYSSNHPEYAAVNATTGQVTPKAEGTAQITATLAASGCYKSATATYTVVVSAASCTEAAGTVTAEDLGCDGMRLTVSDYEADASIQWYKDGVSLGSSYQAATCTVTVAGTYYAVTHKTCDRTSNSIELADKAVTASKLVDGWYVKNGRITPDIALVQTEGAESFIVKSGETTIWNSDSTITTGFGGCGFHMGTDGIIYLNGAQTDGSAPSGLSAGDETLTITAKVCSKIASVTVVMHKQIATTKPVLAFVVTGTEKGGFTEGITSAQTTGVDLYNEIAKNFDVLATNIYSTDDEQKLKEYYSQFDILCITDYPNTKTKGVNKKSYVDAMGALIDIRPILTMEAWVSGLTNWKSKGISGTPKSPTTRQYSMLLQCKDHEIFSGTNPTTVGSGDETMYRIDMVDKTQEEYATLDATYGEGVHQKDEGYQYGKKPALQGFTYDASMSSLLPIGRIDDGAGNDLEVGVERQAVMEARLLVLGINSYAMERLEDDGQTIVINALKYLLKKDAEDISDCSNYFLGGAEGDPYSWKNPDNWSGSTLPDRTQEVRIVARCIISDTIARANSVKIITGGKFNHGSQTANGSLTINPTGSLIVDGKIYAATAPNYFEKRATEPEDLVVKADDSYTGTLIFDNEDGETQATIEMYSPSHWEPENGKYVKYWSYVGMPIKDVHIPDYFYGAFTYYFNEAKGWEKRFDNDIMQPFEGIGLSMQAGHKETFYGTMVSTENTDITITNHTGYGDGDNLIGNSWTAPIQIANFDAEDFGSCWATVYIFNTGKGGNTYVNANADNDGAAKAGQWLGVPIGVAALGEYTGLKVIPAMNAFLVHDTLSTSTTLHLDYDKLVRDDATTNSQINEKMRAPSRHPRKKKDVDGLMRIRVVGEKTNTDVWMLQDERFSERYDNGWEAYFSGGDNRSPVLYAQSAVGPMGIVALQDLDGTVLGFAPSRDGNDYTFTFQYRGEDEYYLNDLKLQQSVLIDADNNYAFTYEKGDTNRFYVSRTPLAPQTPTGVDNASGATQSTKAIKVIYNGKLYIIRSGRVYSAEGILVK